MVAPAMTAASNGYQDGIYSIHYDSANHISVLFSWKGSVWKKTLPYCIVNGIIAFTIQYLKDVRGVDLGFSDKGHSMMTLFVSFLIVSRVSISLGRYNEARGYLGKLYRESRELIQNVCIFTKSNQSLLAKQTRHDIAYNMSVLLRMTMAVIDYPSESIPCWTLKELNGTTREYVMKNIELARKNTPNIVNAEMNMRVPIHMSLYIRDMVYNINNSLQTPDTIGPWQFGKLFGSIDNFMGAYYGMRKFLTTPFPFPLVQMARTFMFIYLYTLPFAILDSVDRASVHFSIVFLVTYGFVGLETVSIELDDPFGDDDNDFNNMGMMLVSIRIPNTFLLLLLLLRRSKFKSY